MNYPLKALKYSLIRNRIMKQNVFVPPEGDGAKIYLFFASCGTNMGDHAIVEAEKKFIRGVLGESADIAEVYTSCTESALKALAGKVRKNDIIVLSGGGYIGDEYIEIYKPLLKLLKMFRSSRIIVFPQTFFFHSEKRAERFCRLIKRCSDMDIFVREPKSRELFEKYGINAFLVPDIVFTAEFDTAKVPRGDKVLVCIRNDVERNISGSELSVILKEAESIGRAEIADTVESEIFPIEKRAEALNSMLRKFSSSRLVITDRIHGMIFAYLTDTPCIAVSNYNHKVESEYEWIKDCGYITFVKDVNERNIKDAADAVLSCADRAKAELGGKFSALEESLKKNHE